jgi:phosphoribosylglycinamide formyltransferase-1
MTTSKIETPLARLAVLISGTGRSLQNLIELAAAGKLPVQIALVIASRAGAGGIEFARQAGIPVTVLARDPFNATRAYSEAIFAACRDADVQLVVLAGFLKHLLIPADFQRRVINIHPALLPAFGGQGYYGKRVHEAVLESGARRSGCTVHYVDDEYDHGPIILQRTVPVLDDDTAESLAARVFAQELIALPEAIRQLVERAPGAR